MLRLLILALAVCVLVRWVFGRWPWDYLRARPRGALSRRRARALLGVTAHASREEVIAAHRRLVAQVHPDRGGSTAAMQEANGARDLLLAGLPDKEARPVAGSSEEDPPGPSRD